MPDLERPIPADLVVAPYDPAWPHRGAVVAADLQAMLAPLALRVEHIGSTSIPGMAAKPVLDFQVSVTDLDAAAAAFDGPLGGFGLVRRPYEQDHVPAGRSDSPDEWMKRLWSTPPGGRRRGRAMGGGNRLVAREVAASM